MALVFKTPQEVADEYLLNVKALKPEVDISRTDSDWWVRGQVVGSVVSGVYADQQLISNDGFPQSARRAALSRWLDLYLDDTFIPAQPARGVLRVTGASGSSVPVGTQFPYEPNGNVYQATSAASFGSATAALVAVQSIAAGQSQNLLDGAELSVTNPPAGVNNKAYAVGPISDGRNAESTAEGAARVLARIRSPIQGGTQSDYEQWAQEADPAVVAANVLRFPFGLGTVGVVVVAGTTDIDEAIDNGQPVVLQPSQELLSRVDAYIHTKAPLTDCPTVLAPVPTPIDVTVRVRYRSGNSSTVLSGQTLTQAQLVQREVSRALYKTPPGGRTLGASGFVVCADIEESMDLRLSDLPYTEGTLPILVDRQVADLSATGANRLLLATQYAVPGTITVLEMNP